MIPEKGVSAITGGPYQIWYDVR